MKQVHTNGVAIAMDPGCVLAEEVGSSGFPGGYPLPPIARAELSCIQLFTRCLCLQNIHNKWVMAKFAQTNGLGSISFFNGKAPAFGGGLFLISNLIIAG